MGINWNPKAAACFFKRMKWRWGGRASIAAKTVSSYGCSVVTTW
jgi:hypothetical protein